MLKTENVETAQQKISRYIDKLHSIAEEFKNDTKNPRPDDQCILRWSANILAEKLIDLQRAGLPHPQPHPHPQMVHNRD